MEERGTTEGREHVKGEAGMANSKARKAVDSIWSWLLSWKSWWWQGMTAPHLSGEQCWLGCLLPPAFLPGDLAASSCCITIPTSVHSPSQFVFAEDSSTKVQTQKQSSGPSEILCFYKAREVHEGLILCNRHVAENFSLNTGLKSNFIINIVAI